MSKLYMEGKSFDDLFTDRREWDSKKDGGPQDVEPNTDVGHYMLVSGVGGHRGFWVRPRPELVAWVTENMLRVNNDTKYFEVVLREDGSALILVKYDQILGGRWLTIVPSTTLPWVAAA